MMELQKIQDIFRTVPRIKLKNTSIQWKKVAIFLLFELVFSAITAPTIIFYGPFENIKSVVVGSLYTTYSHKYMAEFFLSQEAIDRIIGKDGYFNDEKIVQEEVSTDQPVQDINIAASHSEKVSLTYIDGGRSFQGYLITIDDPSLVKVATSEKLPIEGERASTIAKRNKALAAINAGGFTYSESWSSTGGAYEGFIIQDGKVTGNVYP
ncbi:MAG: exopolysaccharide biosynthesis protein, partial [Clostridiales bacterium]|nr:exopolysaccharide biosynthesis protein [Clostridiales bacterium]